MTSSTKEAFSFLITLGQCLMIIPVDVPPRISRSCWSILNISCTIMLTLISLIQLMLCLIFLINQKDKFISSSEFVYVLTVAIYKVCFVYIGKRWHNFLEPWYEIDVCMKGYRMVEKFDRKMRIIIVVFVIFGVGEHILFICSQDIMKPDQTFGQILDGYFKIIFNYVFFILPYNRYAAIIFQVINWLSTLTWTFADIYLIVLVIPLTFRFRQIRDKINYMMQHEIGEKNEWSMIRDHFQKISELCQHTEDFMAPVLVVSFGNKLYVVLYQLLGFIKEHQSNKQIDEISLFNRIYFGLSFAIILGRLVSVTWFTASVDTESQEIATLLFSVPSQIYNHEVERFVMNSTLTPPILSGFKVFYLRKSLILKIATSIIVYELVLLQFQNRVTSINT
ncbi:hypothetical protein GWI33_014360 [Rhynchophorus ferrugineus]|uniref:Gustatory receptor n=1 Tax=Rhynchophorus ferrugineus TaxID=354439 RepID=A0A834I1K7_RHYFE|nr:hypothetical protein GWI33_014360 [Rhynchophorus ferrugineus]